MESIIDLLHARIGARKANIVVQCKREIKLTAFQGEMRQVFSNFLRNSLDAASEAGSVTLRAATYLSVGDEQRVVRITVSDNGHGISPTGLSNIFQPFFTTKGTIGNGLGLWVSKQIIEKHGGKIQVRSRTSEPHQGTTFSVVLPVTDS